MLKLLIYEKKLQYILSICVKALVCTSGIHMPITQLTLEVDDLLLTENMKKKLYRGDCWMYEIGIKLATSLNSSAL